MSDIMLLGALRMPYEMAMSDEMSRLQFHSRAQEAADRIVSDEAEIARLTAERDAAMAGRVKIKPLVWQYHGGNEYSARLLSTGMRYFYNHEGWCLDGDWMQFTPPSATDADKQSAAQADYEARILAALQPAPAPQAREITVQEAAEVLLNCADDLWSHEMSTATNNARQAAAKRGHKYRVIDREGWKAALRAIAAMQKGG